MPGAPKPPKPEPVPNTMRGSRGQILMPWGPGGTPNDVPVYLKGEDKRDMRDPEQVGLDYLLRR